MVENTEKNKKIHGNAIIARTWNDIDLVIGTVRGHDVIKFESLGCLLKFCVENGISDAPTFHSWEEYQRFDCEDRPPLFYTGQRWVFFHSTDSHFVEGCALDYVNPYTNIGYSGRMTQEDALKCPKGKLLSADEWQFVLENYFLSDFRLGDAIGFILYPANVTPQVGVKYDDLKKEGCVFLHSIRKGYWTSTPGKAAIFNGTSIEIATLPKNAKVALRLVDDATSFIPEE